MPLKKALLCYYFKTIFSPHKTKCAHQEVPSWIIQRSLNSWAWHCHGLSEFPPLSGDCWCLVTEIQDGGARAPVSSLLWDLPNMGKVTWGYGGREAAVNPPPAGPQFWPLKVPFCCRPLHASACASQDPTWEKRAKHKSALSSPTLHSRNILVV